MLQWRWVYLLWLGHRVFYICILEANFVVVAELFPFFFFRYDIRKIGLKNAGWDNSWGSGEVCRNFLETFWWFIVAQQIDDVDKSNALGARVVWVAIDAVCQNSRQLAIEQTPQLCLQIWKEFFWERRGPLLSKACSEKNREDTLWEQADEILITRWWKMIAR